MPFFGLLLGNKAFHTLKLILIPKVDPTDLHTADKVAPQKDNYHLKE